MSPWQAAWASAAAFTVGALVPLLTIVLMPAGVRVVACFVAVVVALALTGTLGAHLGGADRRRATVRTVLGGAVAMAVACGIGTLVGHSV